MELSEWLIWLVAGGGAGVVTYWLLERLPLEGWTAEAKRYLALSLSALLACVAFAASVGLDYRPDPGTAQAWFEALFAVAFVAVTSGQVVHGRLRLDK